MKLDPDDIEAIAQRVLELQHGTPKDSDPWFTCVQAQQYLNFSRASFFRARQQFADALKPCSEHPLRWSRNALDVFKMTRGAPMRNRPGRKRKELIAA